MALISLKVRAGIAALPSSFQHGQSRDGLMETPRGGR
jgi:hypothetical protein